MSSEMEKISALLDEKIAHIENTCIGSIEYFIKLKNKIGWEEP